MSEPDSPQAPRIQHWLEQLQAGDPSALDELIRHAGGRLEKLTRRILRDHPALRRWVETNDVFQGAVVRLMRALRELRVPTLQDFFALATQQIRRELIDLARHYYGPRGTGANHASWPVADESGAAVCEPLDRSHDGSGLAEWTELHRHIEQLPAEERAVVELLFYQGLSQAEAAALLNVAVRTVQRRWHGALLALNDIWRGQWPGDETMG